MVWFTRISLWSIISQIFSADDNDTISTVLALADNNLDRVSGKSVM